MIDVRSDLLRRDLAQVSAKLLRARRLITQYAIACVCNNLLDSELIDGVPVGFPK
jgi:hypothetical protein